MFLPLKEKMRKLVFAALLTFFCIACGDASPDLLRVAEPDQPASPDYVAPERQACGPGDVAPPNRVITGERVTNLMALMEKNNYDAYIVPSGDSHQSEYTAPADARRGYVSGFDGSAGTAVVMRDGQRALWTDGRYFLQADAQLDCEWQLMRSKEEGVPTVSQFLQQLEPGKIVSADATLLPYKQWLDLEKDLTGKSIIMQPSDGNLVDTVWDADTTDPRPAYSTENVFLHPAEYTGRTADEKLTDVRSWLAEHEAAVLVVTALDEVAWLYNLRGADVPYNPVFMSYSIVTPTTATIYVEMTKVPEDVKGDETFNNVVFANYDQFLTDLDDLTSLGDTWKVVLPSNAYSDGCSFEVYGRVSEKQRMMEATPTLTMKARKNNVEVTVMREALIKDGIALTDFLAFLDKEIADGKSYTEISAENVLRKYREKQDTFMLESFGTISSFGDHGSIIHYKATNETDAEINDSSLYLLDSGGQYKGATTDVTRTMHYGTPLPEQKQMYTRVLQGVIDFVSIAVPAKTKHTEVEILARRPLWLVGENYRHGTSHGIGSCLNVHEPLTEYVEEGNVASDEPGYYVDGSWGIRIENQMLTVDTDMMFDVKYLKFETLTMVPYEPKLIDESLLTQAQIDWLNEYNQQVRSTVGARMKEQGLTLGYEYLMTRTEPISRDTDDGSGAGASTGSVALVVLAVLMLWC